MDKTKEHRTGLQKLNDDANLRWYSRAAAIGVIIPALIWLLT